MNIEELLLTEKHTLDLGYDKYEKCWTAHVCFPAKDLEGYTDGVMGKGTTPTGALDSARELLILKTTGGCSEA